MVNLENFLPTFIINLPIEPFSRGVSHPNTFNVEMVLIERYLIVYYTYQLYSMKEILIFIIITNHSFVYLKSAYQ